jgi:hypothetical protein
LFCTPVNLAVLVACFLSASLRLSRMSLRALPFLLISAGLAATLPGLAFFRVEEPLAGHALAAQQATEIGAVPFRLLAVGGLARRARRRATRNSAAQVKE